MIEHVSTQGFTSQPERHKPEEFKYVKFRIEAGVARMTLSRPEHNLLNEAMLREIAGGITHAGERNDVKLIVDRKSTRLNSSHSQISYAVFCLKKKKKTNQSCTSITMSIKNTITGTILTERTSP